MMDFDFRLLLVITGVGLVGYLAWDGWRSRNRDQYKFKLEKNIPPEPVTTSAPREGFDTDGIGRARVRGDAPSSVSEEIEKATPVKSSHVEPTFGEEIKASAPNEPEQVPVGNMGDLFGGESRGTKIKPKATPKPVPATENKVTDIQVISLTVHAPEGKMFNGSELSIALLEASLTFGDMDIFHRHLDGTPNTEIQFSVANAVKPGTFDPENLDSFITPGISLFMQMPGPKDPRNAYEVMVKAAEQIAKSLNGFILDGARQPFSAESRKAHDSQIRHFERSKSSTTA